MADDLNKKQLMVQSAQGNPSDSLISKTTVIKELGFDSDKEYENKQEELKKIMKLKSEEYTSNAEAQGSANVISALYTADANMRGMKRQQTHEMMMQKEQDKEMQKMKEEAAPAAEQEAQQVSFGKKISLPNLILVLTERFAKLSQTDMNEFKIRMLSLKNSMPALYSEVFSNLKEMNLIEKDLNPNLDNLPEEAAGNIPSYNQGGVTADTPPSPAEAGASPKTINQAPEQRPPRSSNSSI
jgi:hypothetical protein